ncbi:hypothetical protein D3C87_755540 [compost metagenome]
MCTVLFQALLQLRAQILQGRFVELVSLVHQDADLIVKALPRRIEGIGHDHLFFEQLAGFLQGCPAAIGLSGQVIACGFAGTQGILQLQAILGLELFNLRQQFIETGTRSRVDEPLPQRIRPHCPTFAQDLGDPWRDEGDELAQLAHVALVVATEAGLAGDELAENLCAAHQLADQGTFALQGVFRLLGLERGDHFIAFAIKHRDLLRVAGHRRQPLQASQNILLKGADLRFDIAGLAGLAEADIDLHQVVQGFQIAP